LTWMGSRICSDGFMSAHRLALEGQSIAVVHDSIQDCIGNGSIAEHGREPLNSNE
jgi:hypothetical protein